MCYIPVKYPAFFDLNQFYLAWHFYHISKFMFYINFDKNCHKVKRVFFAKETA
ncbi:Hypothetical protein ETEE_0902 [Edwardsiella anguillarum ET080813]|uniref:Uncharacterized protein n=1 Tax=Edwardsiella anguillarum ET080813 TaxID=667120 RepID=A0A076LNW7_9GAMM|nr:Hypothetical protein ETEE_0902 [Edwardsiella anguillarum ET080813]